MPDDNNNGSSVPNVEPETPSLDTVAVTLRTFAQDNEGRTTILYHSLYNSENGDFNQKALSALVRGNVKMVNGHEIVADNMTGQLVIMYNNALLSDSNPSASIKIDIGPLDVDTIRALSEAGLVFYNDTRKKYSWMEEGDVKNSTIMPTNARAMWLNEQGSTTVKGQLGGIMTNLNCATPPNSEHDIANILSYNVEDIEISHVDIAPFNQQIDVGELLLLPVTNGNEGNLKNFPLEILGATEIEGEDGRTTFSLPVTEQNIDQIMEISPSFSSDMTIGDIVKNHRH